MAEMNVFCRFALLYIVYYFTSVCAGDVCVQKTPCKCIFPNGTGIDLSPAAKSSFYSAYYQVQSSDSYDLSTYYLHPCSDIPTIYSNNTASFCHDPLSVYREVVHLVKNSATQTNTTCNALGTAELSLFTNDGKSIVYRNLASNNTILLVCAQGPNQLAVTSLDDPHEILLTFYSKDACLKQLEEPGRSFGSTLLIIFFSLIIFYLVLGVCTKKFLMGATGIEVIPNLGFWTELPHLVKDGWAFLISGCRLPARGGPAASPDPNSYDSI
ncbi:hypothetical protein ACJJTC_009499 [Scirpophaga incertulas]